MQSQIDFVQQALNRKQTKDGKKVLNLFGRTIDAFVEHGMFIYTKIDKNKFREVDIPIATLWMQFLNLLDSISILSKKGQSDGIISVLRSLFETQLNLQYLLTTYKDNGSVAYLVCFANREIRIRQGLDFSTEKGEKFHNEWNKQFPDIKIENTPIEQSAKNLYLFLERPEIKAVNEEWKRTKKKYRSEPNWYSLYNGPKNLKELAYTLDYGLLYEILYSDLSGYVHAVSTVKRVKGYDGIGIVPGLRNAEKIQQLMKYTINIVQDLNLKLITEAIPEFLDQHKKWYIENVYSDCSKILYEEELIKVDYSHI